MAHELITLLGRYGLWIVFGNVLVKQLGVPVPALPTLVIAGALVAAGKLPAPALIAVAVLACLIADSAWFAAGRRYGNGVMKTLCRLSLTPDSCVSDTQDRFERWGTSALVVAKFVPGLAVIAAPLAGAARVRWPSFLFFDSLGSTLWVGAEVICGMLLGEQIELLLARVGSVGLSAAIVLGLLLAAYVAFKWWQRWHFFRRLRMARISVNELYRLMAADPAPVIVDVRSALARSLQPQRIPGAVQVVPHAFERPAQELPRDRDIGVYCSCPNEASAAQVAKLLIDNGFTRVRPLLGGLDAWIAAGYSVETLAAGEAAVDVVTAPLEHPIPRI